MQTNRALGTLAVLVVLAVLLSLAGSSVAQVKKGKSRPMLTKHLMKGLVKEHCGSLKNELDAGPAKNDGKAWESLELHAALLNEASYVLMADGRCPDGTWANAAGKLLRGGSEGVLKAIKARDAGAAKKAFGAMTKACGSCHKAHKKKKQRKI